MSSRGRRECSSQKKQQPHFRVGFVEEQKPSGELAASWAKEAERSRDAAAADPDPAAREAGRGEALAHLRILDWAWAGGVRGHHEVPVRLHRSCLVRLRVAAAAAT